MNNRFPTSSRTDAYGLPAFRKDYLNLSSVVREEVKEKIREVLDTGGDPIDHEDVKFLPAKGERGVWRIKIGGRGQEVDHRAVFDLEPDGTVIFLRVQHRDVVYENPF